MVAPTFTLPVTAAGSGYVTTREDLESGVQTVVNALNDKIEPLENLAEGGNVTTATWTELAAITGVRANQRADVLTDAGTHTDPVVGGVVDNEGIYAWSLSPAGWERIGELSDEAAAAEVIAARDGEASLSAKLAADAAVAAAATAAVNDRLSVLVYPQIIGYEGALAASDGGLSASTVIYAEVTSDEGVITSIDYFGTAVGTLKIRRGRIVAGAWTSLDSFTFTTATGEQTETVGDFYFDAGDVLAIYGDGLIERDLGVTGSAGYYVISGDAASGSVGTLFTNAHIALRFNLTVGPISTNKLRDLAVVADDLPSIARRDLAVKSVSSQTVYGLDIGGSPTDLGENLGTGSTVWDLRPLDAGEVTQIEVYNRGASPVVGAVVLGTFSDARTISIYETIGYTFAVGLNTLIPGATGVPDKLYTKEGTYIGLKADSAGLAYDLTGDLRSGQFYGTTTGTTGDLVMTGQTSDLLLAMDIGISRVRKRGSPIEKVKPLYFCEQDFAEAGISPFLVTTGTWTFGGDGWAVSGGTAGIATRLSHRRAIAVQHGFCRADFQFTEADQVALFGLETSLADIRTLCGIDIAGNNFIAYAQAASAGALSAVATQALAFTLVQDRTYRIQLDSQGRNLTFTLTDLTTGQAHTYSQADGDVANPSYPIGRGAGRVTMARLGTAGLKFGNVRHGTLQRNPKVVIYGDSITTGYGAPWEDSWPGLLTEALSGAVAINAVGGFTSTKGLQLLEMSLHYYDNAQYLITALGTNDTAATATLATNLALFHTIATRRGLIPIIACPPLRGDSNTVVQDTIVPALLATGYRTIRFDLATSVGADGTTWDSSKFLGSSVSPTDNVHPNATGHLAMYNRIRMDVPEIFE